MHERDNYFRATPRACKGMCVCMCVRVVCAGLDYIM